MIYNIESEFDSHSGVYKISSNIDDRIYIGSTKNLRSRYRDHARYFKNQNHFNRHLHYFYKKYGKGSLSMSIIELCKPDKLIEREQYWIDTLNPKFNLSPTAKNTTGIIRTDDFKLKCHERMIGFKQTEERKEKISKRLKEKYASGERKPIHLAPQIIVKCPVCGREFITKQYKNKTKKYCNIKCRYSDENFKLKFANSNHIIGENNKKNKPVIQLTLNNEFVKKYYSITNAAKENNMVLGCISACCNGATQTSYGYKWIFESGSKDSCKQASA